MNKRIGSFVILILMLLLATMPVMAQDTTVYDTDGVTVFSASSSPVNAELRGYYTRNFNGQDLVGPEFCASKQLSRTQWATQFVFPQPLANVLEIQLIASASVKTDFQVTNTDAISQVVTMNSQGVVEFTPSGLSMVQVVAQGNKSAQIASGQTLSDSVSGSDNKTLVIPISTPQASRVDVSARSGSYVSGPGNLTASVNTFASAQACIFYGYEPASLGDYVWIDANANGIQDSGEVGIPNVTVTLTGPVTGTTITDAAGLYTFDMLPPGAYTVTFSNIPAGYIATQSLVGNDKSIDSNGMVSNVTLAPGQHDPTIDLGLKGIGRIGDYVWMDANSDGIQDTTETGVSGVTVQLYSCPTGTQLASTTTDQSGKYIFPNLIPGSYKVKFTVPVEGGFRFTLADIGDDNLDSDADRINGTTDCIPLSPNKMENLTLDAGMLQDSDAYISAKQVYPTTAVISQTVTYTVEYGNNGTGTAFEAQLVDEFPYKELEILAMPTSCQLQPLGQYDERQTIICALGDLLAKSKGSLVFTARVISTKSALANNHVRIISQSIDTDLGNNDSEADLLVNPTAPPDTSGGGCYLPIIRLPLPTPVPDNPCQEIEDATLHILTEGVEYTSTISSQKVGSKITLSGIDLPYKSDTKLWITFPTLPTNEVTFTWTQYAPFYTVVKEEMGKNEFTFHGGYPGRDFEVLVHFVYEPTDNFVCESGATFDNRIDP